MVLQVIKEALPEGGMLPKLYHEVKQLKKGIEFSYNKSCLRESLCAILKGE